MGSWEGSCWGWGRCAPGPLLLLSLLWAAPFTLLGEETRQVSLEVISDWAGPPENLLHIRAVGTNSTLHYVWSTLGPPAVLLVATNTPHSALSVNWSLLLSSEPDGGLMVLPKDSVQFSSALVFTRTEVSVHTGSRPGTRDNRWEVESGEGRGSVGAGTGWPSSSCLACLSPQLDQLLWGSLPSGFVQWRPVAFSQKQGGRESALPCHASPPYPTLAYLLPQSPIVRAFFGSQNNFCAFNLTFGTPTGPGYWDHHYLSWSALLGVGAPPVDALSPLVLGIMAVALGAPALLLLVGGLFLLLGPKGYSEYQPIN
ncbi:glycosylated lysosomal membrane protein [Pteropus vampyrus]|uniref:Glycosylated lysosomal membrane protein n=1 Tax=Pteropus vampyrus TaxID=132908 RepID=A0A6P6CR62_PTEVA|nr:glycosylated lysosomal membrane protein [Pteropus vampyrus]